MRNPTPRVRCGTALDDPDLRQCPTCLELVRNAITTSHAYLTALCALEGRARGQEAESVTGASAGI